MHIRRLAACALSLLLAVAFAVPGFAARSGYNMPYHITVDLTNQIVTIYATQDDSIVRQMLCSSGENDSTPHGTFYMDRIQGSRERRRWTYYWQYNVYVQYASRIKGGILFHSIPCTQPSRQYIQQSALRTFGFPTSHGCLRLRWQDAKFISDNCRPGTKVEIYASGQPDQGLRELLYEESYAVENGIPYTRFLAIPEASGELGLHSRGPNVQDLQNRLWTLGFFNGEVTGEYNAATVNAVKRVQTMLGQDQTGIADGDFRTMIFAEDAPIGMNVLLQNGSNGPVVRRLQEELRYLGLYSGSLDSVYDPEVAEAVKRFQSVYGYAEDGVAAPEVQKAIAHEADKLRLLFWKEPPNLEEQTFELYLGTVDTLTSLRIRQEASSKSAPLERVVTGDVVIGLEPGKPWSRIQYRGCTGYLKNSSLHFSRRTMRVLEYSGAGSETCYRVGHTLEEYESGAVLPADSFADYLDTEGAMETFPDLRVAARVATPDTGISLNLRSAPDIGADVLGVLPYGTQVEVLRRGDEWSEVTIQGVTGYLKSEYLECRAVLRKMSGADVPVAAEEVETDKTDQDKLYAMVWNNRGKAAEIYNADSDDAEVVAYLMNQSRVRVYESSGGWSKIAGENRKRGFMRDRDLRFREDE